MMPMSQSQVVREDPGGWSALWLLAFVATVTVKVVGVAPSTFSVAGTEQVASFGAPAQLSEAVPLIPLPPIEAYRLPAGRRPQSLC
jgi:hypothetical protein